MTQKERRLDYFIQCRKPKNILKVRNTETFLEVTCINNDRTVIYRVYEDEDEPDGFFISYDKTISTFQK